MPKSLQQFVRDNDGKLVEVAGSPGAVNQCVDLANAYLRDVLDHPIVEHTNARDFPSKLPDFEWIENKPDLIPEPGDIMIWQNNEYGHISVFLEGDSKSFKSFDQNFPLKTPAHIQRHTYLRPKVAGWLRPKSVADKLYTQEEYDKIRLERDANWDKYQNQKTQTESLEETLKEETGKKDKEHRDFVNELTEIFNPLKPLPGITDEGVVLKAARDIVQSEYDLTKETSDLKKKLVEKEDQLKEKGTEYDQKLATVTAEADRLSKQLDTLKRERDALKEQQKELEPIRNFINKVKSILRRDYGEETSEPKVEADGSEHTVDSEVSVD